MSFSPPPADFDLFPAAASAIADLQKPSRYQDRYSPMERYFAQKRSDEGSRFDLLLDALVKIKDRGRRSGYDPTFDIAAEALEALDQLDAWIDARDGADEALQAAE